MTLLIKKDTVTELWLFELIVEEGLSADYHYISSPRFSTAEDASAAACCADVVHFNSSIFETCARNGGIFELECLEQLISENAGKHGGVALLVEAVHTRLATLRDE
jgi:hypothetical protein